jgi:hypothetical protein
MQHLEGSGTPVLYIGRTVLKGKYMAFSSYTVSRLTFGKETPHLVSLNMLLYRMLLSVGE